MLFQYTFGFQKADVELLTSTMPYAAAITECVCSKLATASARCQTVALHPTDAGTVKSRELRIA
jgi:hypothetical protein